MKRREALKKVTYLLGGTMAATGFGVFIQGCGPTTGEQASGPFTEGEEATLAMLAETLIPTTDTPGAKAAGVGPFIAMMVLDCYPEDVRKAFAEGLIGVEKMSKTKFKKQFTELGQKEREEIVKALDKEVEERKEQDKLGKAEKSAPHFFQLTRELTYLGYFSSEIGATQALNYVQIPGRYESCIPLKEGQRAWAT